MKFNDRLRNFMKGRYGPDELYNFLFFVYILLFVINLFLKNNVLNFLEIVVIIILFYRFFSTKIYVRSNENQKFIKLKKILFKPLVNIKRNVKDKEHVYKKCHKCKTILKLPLPSKRGFNKAKCPHCKNKVVVFTLKKEKIDIIIKNKNEY